LALRYRVEKVFFGVQAEAGNEGEVPEWTKGTDCKSVASGFGGSNPPLPTILTHDDCVR